MSAIPTDQPASLWKRALLYLMVMMSALTTMLLVAPASAQTITVTTNPSPFHIDQGTLYNHTPFLLASGGTGPYSYSATVPQEGITINSDGTLSGLTCAGNGNRAVTGTVTGTTGTGVVNLSLVVNRAPAGACTLLISVSGTPSDGTVGTAYTSGTTYSASGATGPFTYSIASGALPPGLSIDPSSGAISGTPTVAGTYTYTVFATNGTETGVSGIQTIVISAATGELDMIATPSSTTQVGSLYSQQNVGFAGTGPYTFTLTGGALPDGTTLDPNTGLVSGYPTTFGPFTYEIQVTDDLGAFVTKTISGTLAAAAALDMTATPSTQNKLGAPYSQTNVATGGVGPITYTLTGGALPAGTTLDPATGLVSGLPTATGPYSYTITATDSTSPTALTVSKTTSGVIADVGLTVGPETLPDAIQGIPYLGTVVASGGVGPYTYTICAGALPSGFTLNSTTGAITGTSRAAAGAYTFTVCVVDADGYTGSRTYTLTLDERPDPTLDREVQGMIDNHFRTASRFGEGQLNNVMRHMDSLHSGLRCGIDNKLAVTGGDQQVAAANDPTQANGSVATSVNAGNTSPVAFKCDDKSPLIALWTAGSIDFATDKGLKFNADALTVGVDLRASDRLIAGIAFGHGWNDSKTGDKGTRSKDEAETVLAYASYKLARSAFFDVALGQSWIDFASHRYVTADSSAVTGARKGDTKFASASLTLERSAGVVLLSGFARYSYLDINLDGFAEQGTTPYALTFEEASQKVQLLSTGAKAETTILTSWGQIIPSARAEYRHRIAGDYHQAMAYSDMLNRQYTLNRASTTDDTLSISGGLRFKVGTTDFGVEYGTSGTALESLNGGEVRVMLRTGF